MRLATKLNVSDPEEDQYEKSTNDVIMDLAGKNSVGSLQSYDDSSLPDSPSICTAEMDVSFQL